MLVRGRFPATPDRPHRRPDCSPGVDGSNLARYVHGKESAGSRLDGYGSKRACTGRPYRRFVGRLVEVTQVSDAEFSDPSIPEQIAGAAGRDRGGDRLNSDAGEDGQGGEGSPELPQRQLMTPVRTSWRWPRTLWVKLITGGRHGRAWLLLHAAARCSLPESAAVSGIGVAAAIGRANVK